MDALKEVSEYLGVNSDLNTLQKYFDSTSSIYHLYVPYFSTDDQVTLKFILSGAIIEFEVTVIEFEEMDYDVDHDYGSFTQEVLSVLKVSGYLSDFINSKLEAGELCIEHEIERVQEEPDYDGYDDYDRYEYR